ncbi:MAG: hypothetical protein OXH84_00035 [Gammaproteobacteria bacterium]|nr:hypothetical protein [Gammaproteobacteria bacterium]
MSDHVRKVNNNTKDNLHGYSAVLLIIVDNAFWGANTLTLGLATPLVSLLAFVLTGIGVFLVQMAMAKDGVLVAITKGFVVGVAAGVPTGVVGTVGGFYFLSKAGIRALRGRN